MFQRLRAMLTSAFRISPADQVPVDVAANFKHNVVVNTLDIVLFIFGDSMVSINTIMPVFAATLTDSPFLIGLMPALVNACWFLPQLFMSGPVSRVRRKLPLALRMAVVERIPYLFLPVLALAIPVLEKPTAVVLLIVVMTLRGLAGGMIALPWQEVLASVIPITHRARFFGFSRVLGQIAGVIGSAVAGIILARLAYPTNFALAFFIAVIAQWLSFFVYRRNREPEPVHYVAPEPGKKSIDFALFGQILKKDANFRAYALARSMTFIGNMGSAFIAVYGLQQFKLADGHAAVFTAIIFVSGIVGYAIFGSLGDRIGPKRVIFIALLVWVLGLVSAIFAPTIWVYYLVFASFGIYSAGMILGDSILVMELGEEKQRPAYLGLARTLTGITLIIAPFLAGTLVERFGYGTMFGTAIVFTVVSAWLMLRVKDRPRGR